MKREISYIGDYDYAFPEGVYMVEKDADYVKVCHLLTSPAGDTSPLNIWVKKRHLFTWLQRFCELVQLPCDFVEKTARLILAEAWNVILPEWLTEEDIVAQKLLDLDMKNENPCRFEGVLLEQFLNPSCR